MSKRAFSWVALVIVVAISGLSQIKSGNGQIADTQSQQTAEQLTEGAAIPGTVSSSSQNGSSDGLNASNSVRVAPVHRGQCRAYAPAGWNSVSVSDRGDVADFVSGDGQSYAAWGIRGVNRALEPYYGPVYSDPMTSSRFLVAKAAEAMGDRSHFSFVGQGIRFGDYFAHELRSQASKAVVVYRVYGAPPIFSRESYVISLRIAITPLTANDFALKTAVGVAASIDCKTMFVPPAANEVPLPRPGDPIDARRKREPSELDDYNVQLGTQTYHSPTTGENILVDPSTAITSGPQGEGVYRKSGNTLELLVPGRR